MTTDMTISTTPRRMTEADASVGAWVRNRRAMLGLSQEQLGVMVGITYQQVHKHERGINRITIGRLINYCKALCVHPSVVMNELFPVPYPTLSIPSRITLEHSVLFTRLTERQQVAVQALTRALLGE